MNDNHRKLIKQNIEKLIHVTDYAVMIRGCLWREVLTQTMVDIIEQDGKDSELDKNRMLFEKLTHRGPKAYHNILEIFKENDYHDAYKMLSVSTIPSATFDNDDVVIDTEEPKFVSLGGTKHKDRKFSYSPPIPVIINNNNNSDEIDDSKISNDGLCSSKPQKLRLEPMISKTSFQFDSDVEVKRAANFGSHPKLQVYNMKSKRRGVFFFVNIIKFQKALSEKENRDGAEKDKENLVTLFSEMNYTIFYYEDLTRDEFNELLNMLLKSEYLDKIDSFVFCVQTHGDMHLNKTIFEFSDGTSTSVEDVIEKFSNTSCKKLVHKPKVFFFPFCRGKISDKEKKISHKIETDGVALNLVPSYSDILICYGTVPGFVTHRDTGFGSWYVRELCKVFAEHACDCHLEDSK